VPGVLAVPNILLHRRLWIHSGSRMALLLSINGKLNLLSNILSVYNLHIFQYGVGVPLSSRLSKDEESLSFLSPTMRSLTRAVIPYYWEHPLRGVWYVSFILVLPLILLNIVGGFHMTEVVETPISKGVSVIIRAICSPITIKQWTPNSLSTVLQRDSIAFLMRAAGRVVL
jgi:hypothetical protein